MLRIFQWVVRFFDRLRMLDEQLQDTWLNKSWPDFMKWWVGGSIAIGIFALVLVCVPGAVLLEINRFYQLLRLGTYPAAGPMYWGLGTFAVAFAAVAVTISFISCPLFMFQIRRAR